VQFLPGVSNSWEELFPTSRFRMTGDTLRELIRFGPTGATLRSCDWRRSKEGAGG
jgi:hypothetical protein